MLGYIIYLTDLLVTGIWVTYKKASGSLRGQAELIPVR